MEKMGFESGMKRVGVIMDETGDSGDGRRDERV